MNVVAAAIVRDGRVLAAQRARPPALLGGWEFPGGKVEPGESERVALVRECEEELGVTVTVRDALGSASEGPVRLTLFAATLDAGEPRAHDDHRALRWVGPSDLDTLGWLPVDRRLLGAVYRRLTVDPRPAPDTKE